MWLPDMADRSQTPRGRMGTNRRLAAIVLVTAVLACSAVTAAQTVEATPDRASTQLQRQQGVSEAAAEQVDASVSEVDDGADAQASTQRHKTQQPYVSHAERHKDPQPGAECPSPQPPTTVQQVMLAHDTFDWLELATQSTANKNARGGQRGGRQQQQQRRSAPWTAQLRKKAQERHAAARHARAAQAQAAGSGAGGSVSTAAVTNEQFRLPLGARESGRGFAGTADGFIPPDEALAVGPHPTRPGLKYVLHSVNVAAEIFLVNADGTKLAQDSPTKLLLDLDIMASMTTFDTSGLAAADPSAWYDAAAKRWVLLWTTFPANASQFDPLAQTAPLLMAVSEGADPLGEWTLWALQSVPFMPTTTEGPWCSLIPGFWPLADYPQASYSDKGIFVSFGFFCLSNDKEVVLDFLSVMYAYPKSVLYKVPSSAAPNLPHVYAGQYEAPASWCASVPEPQRAAVDDARKPFNNFIKPVLPQAPEDMRKPPLFVMKVDNARMSIATLTDESLDTMTSVATAPKMLAAMVGKGANFANTPGQDEGEPVMQQPGVATLLDAGDVGLPFNSGVRSYGSVQHRGLLFLTTLEYWGAGAVRVPSVYWGIFQPSRHLCSIARPDWGLISSRDGLAVSFPAIGAKRDGRALMAYSYSGASEGLPNGLGPAYAGVATSTVGRGVRYPGSGSKGHQHPAYTEGRHHEYSADADAYTPGYSDGGGHHSGVGHDGYTGYTPGPLTPPTIDVVKAGTVSVVNGDDAATVTRWGDYGAAAYVGGDMWFAINWASVAARPETPWNSWISWDRL